MMRRIRIRDVGELHHWFTARGLEPELGGSIPEVGYIIPGVAAGFLVQTDTEVAMIENLISNPNWPREERDAALDSIVSQLCSDAKELGYKHVAGFTKVNAVVERAIKNGFTKHGTYTLISRGV